MITPLYIIPARGGSKGIPGKNIKPLCGRPLIAYTIEVAKECATDDNHIILSTDSEEIAQTGRALDLKVDYMRPAELATDKSGSREVILDAMDWAEKNGIKYDCVVLLQPTSPMRTAEDVKECLNRYSDNIDMVVSVTEAVTNPYYNCYETDAESGLLHISKGDGKLSRRQDAPPAWEYNGAVYVINPKSIRAHALGEFEKRVPFAMPKERSIDIDTPTDWIVAEALIEQTNHRNHPL